MVMLRCDDNDKITEKSRASFTPAYSNTREQRVTAGHPSGSGEARADAIAVNKAISSPPLPRSRSEGNAATRSSTRRSALFDRQAVDRHPVALLLTGHLQACRRISGRIGFDPIILELGQHDATMLGRVGCGGLPIT